MTVDVVVIGAGPAGCVASIELARMGHRVLLLEKDAFPRHKLCGEFLSVEVYGYLERLGLAEEVLEAGAQVVRQARLTEAGGASHTSVLPGTALGLSRYTLDAILSKAAVSAGAEFWPACAVRRLEGDLAGGFRLETDRGEVHARAVVGAYGRRSNLDRELGRRFFQQNATQVAFKAHYRGDLPGGTIEMHGFPGGYCGISPVEDGLWNVCWIADGALLKTSGGTAEAMIERVLARNVHLAGRLARLERVSDRFLAVSQVSFARKPVFERDVCMIGDAAGMITPLCGDGMAVGIRSGMMAAGHLDLWLRGELAAPALRAGYARAWDREFRRRYRIGRLAHEGFVRPAIAHAAVRLMTLWPQFAAWLIRSTRDARALSPMLPLPG